MTKLELLNEGNAFHRQFKEILLRQIAGGKRVIYYCSEGFSTEIKKQLLENYPLKHLELEHIGLR